MGVPEAVRARHGGADGGPEPLWDFSTNANPLGPCEAVLDAVRSADLTRYPDPEYGALRDTIAARYAVDREAVVVGAGASELILRLVRASRGPVLILAPSFGEYARCAAAEGREVIEVATPAEFLALQAQAGVGFVCWPNNPTGDAWPASFLAEAASRGKLVVDFAYAPLAPARLAEEAEAAARGAVRLYAPNKSFGLTGLRAAYALLANSWPELAWRAPAWVIGAADVAFLHATSQPAALDWLDATRPVAAAWRKDLAQGLRQLGLEVRESPASFLLVRVGDAGGIAARLRASGLRVRDASSFGLPAWLRLRAAPPQWRAALLGALEDALRLQAPP